ncbi:MAG: hypothetical protein HOP29_06060 [Phycisphaerales bacterium]|nr:hypothetical protein [Phycisphaerales bacterium]
MKTVFDLLLSKARTPAGVAVLSIATLSALVIVFRPREEITKQSDPEERLFVKVKRAVSGQKIKLDNDQDEYLIYAGIRAPVGGEPFDEEATRRNGELVGDQQKVRLRFDEEHRDADGRLLAYVFVEDDFVNETLVREGLAYVRSTTSSHRFAERLLSAQKEARSARRGIWSRRPGGTERSYAGDPHHGNFHRRTCEELPKIPADRLVEFPSDQAALEKGFAPCAKCKP